MIPFIVIFSVVIGLLALYSWRRCVRKMVLPLWGRRTLEAILAVLALASISYIPLRHSEMLGAQAMELFAAAVGAVFLLFALSVLYDLVMLLGRLWRHEHPRAARVRLIFDLGVITLAAVVVITALAGAARAPQISAHEVPVAGIKAPIRLVHLTDLHLGNSPRLDRDFAASVVAQVNALKPDLVLITGDLVDAPIEKAAPMLTPLADLKSRYGSYFVTGNHEYFHNLDETIQAVKDQNITVLENSHHAIKTHAGTLTLVGLADAVGYRMDRRPPDAQAAFDGVDLSRPVVVLSHQPILVEEMEEGSFDLMLSGHTHGGQIFPFGLLVRAEQPYLRGLYRHDARGRVFVSSGTGFWGPPMRLLAPAEIGVLELVP
jgi:predicted MPP superfamily phosphohydrolase